VEGWERKHSRGRRREKGRVGRKVSMKGLKDKREARGCVPHIRVMKWEIWIVVRVL
jgi:hypothetical protein